MTLARVAAAPITWGVCEVAGWGHRLAAERVLAEMAALGVRATEAGPAGFLPADPAAAHALLDRHGLQLVGGFVPCVLHLPGADVRATVDEAARWLAAAGGQVAVLAAASPGDGYDAAARLDRDSWRLLLANLDAAAAAAAAHGLLAVLHPHVGTAVERAADIERVLEGSAVALCLDTGHLLIGGIEPVQLAKDAGDRLRHVQLKDVDADLAERVAAGRLSYTAAVRRGLYRPLGDGVVDVAGLLDVLAGAGFDGWLVLEQDVALDAEPPPGQGPIHDAGRSLTSLQSLLSDRGQAPTRKEESR